MQINTELSPIVSPKSNVSGSFVSPRDKVLMNFTSNKPMPIGSEKSGEDIHSIEHENNHGNAGYFEDSSHHHHTTTNESYSSEKNHLGGKIVNNT